MNEFDKVFTAVKKRCTNDGVIAGLEGFQDIAREENISMMRLNFYLETLQSLGLLTYSIGHRYIELTTTGRQQHNLFTDQE